MPEIAYLKIKVDHSYLVWFKNSNTYFQLEEPAWFVFKKLVKRYKSATIASEFAERYGVTQDESHTFVNDIRSEIAKLNQPCDMTTSVHYATELNEYDFVPYATHHYRFGSESITFSYDSRALEYYIHPLISHFETNDGKQGLSVFELFSREEKIVFRFNGEVKGTWTCDETHLVKGMIFMYLINAMHNKTHADWLMTVHASAITNGKKTILFSAPPGSGKTTIAAILQARGYQLISDDFVPIDRTRFCAFPFPIAMSVKEGSMELLKPLMPGLEQKSLNYITPGKSVRYMAPAKFADIMSATHPVGAIIFVKYEPSVDCLLEKMNPLKGIKHLLQQAWIAPASGNAAILLERVTQTPFYSLTYSNNHKALALITSLFDHDK